MNNLLASDLHKYYKEISSSIVCSSKQKKKFVNDLKASVNEYVEANSDCTIEDIRTVFGTAEEISISFIQNGNFTKVKKRLNIKRVITSAVMTALLIWCAFAVLSLIDVHLEARGYLTEGLLLINMIPEVKS